MILPDLIAALREAVNPRRPRNRRRLTSQGVQNMKPLHTMRKEIGSIIANEEGIFAASRYLRHSDIRITSAIYADKKKTVTPKAFAGVLSTTSGENASPKTATTAA